MHSEPGEVVEGARRAAERTQSREEWWRGPGGQPNALRAGRSGGGSQEDSETHSELGGVVEGSGGQPNTLRDRRSGGGGQEGSQTHSEPGGVVEWARRAAKRTQSREEWWSGPGGQPNALRVGRSGGGLRHNDIITVSEPQSVHLFFHR